MKTNGMIANASEMNASIDVAQLIPRLPYIELVANGRQTAMVDRTVLAAAWAEAEYCLYASVR